MMFKPGGASNYGDHQVNMLLVKHADLEGSSVNYRIELFISASDVIVLILFSSNYCRTLPNNK